MRLGSHNRADGRVEIHPETKKSIGSPLNAVNWWRWLVECRGARYRARCCCRSNNPCFTYVAAAALKSTGYLPEIVPCFGLFAPGRDADEPWWFSDYLRDGCDEIVVWSQQYRMEHLYMRRKLIVRIGFHIWTHKICEFHIKSSYYMLLHKKTSHNPWKWRY